jgi:hypothetical protein
LLLLFRGIVLLGRLSFLLWSVIVTIVILILIVVILDITYRRTTIKVAGSTADGPADTPTPTDADAVGDLLLHSRRWVRDCSRSSKRQIPN